MGILNISSTGIKDRPSGWLDRCPRIRYLFQWIKNGFPDSDIWNLDWSIAKYTLPRLKRLKEVQHGFPGDLETIEEWDEILDKIIITFDRIVREDVNVEHEKEVLVYESDEWAMAWIRRALEDEELRNKLIVIKAIFFIYLSVLINRFRSCC